MGTENSHSRYECRNDPSDGDVKVQTGCLSAVGGSSLLVPIVQPGSFSGWGIFRSFEGMSSETGMSLVEGRILLYSRMCAFSRFRRKYGFVERHACCRWTMFPKGDRDLSVR